MIIKLKHFLTSKYAVRTHQHHNKDKTDSNDTSNDLNADLSAIVIQKIWRGYKTRQQNKNIAETLQKKRTQEYIM